MGNQMFQLAAGLAMAIRLDADLHCDSSRFGSRNRRLDRPLGLRAFGLDWIESRVPPFGRRRELASVVRLVPDPFRGAVRLRVGEAYDPRFAQVNSTCALAGYFQSWRYFEDEKAAVRAAFDVARLPALNADAEAAIRSARNPVAVHVRRGDYASTAQAIAKFGLLEADYYLASRVELEKRVAEPTYFLFSDEMPLARDVLADWPVTPVASPTALEDFRLMSLCSHFIIANSTFSWWAAWLGTSPGKTVVAPRRWFGPAYEEKVKIDDRLPLDWIRA
jgi:hypothetical protein